MQGSVSFDPSQMVITSGATPAMEILSFCIADPGDAFPVPSPYYPGWDRDIKWRTGEVQKDRALELLNVRPFYFVYLCGVKT
ncbi:hypothetical protein D1007_05536 [Hordeum vulgare]|nr:hypothetical protein D1007_05536 [Hordeum vulgare]